MNRRKFALWGVGFLLLWAGYRTYDRFHPPGLVITFLDVGQGDGTLLQFPSGQTWLIDAGGAFKGWDVGRRVIFPELARKGILTLDRVVMSHPDLDHAGGIYGLLGHLPIRELTVHAEEIRSGHKKLMVALLRKARLHRIPVQAIESELKEEVAGVTLRWFAVRVAGEKSNNRSLVFEWRFGQCSGLFTGDIEAAAEDWLLSKGINEIDLLKVPHHGSKTSSTAEFLRKLSPRWAVFSSGGRESLRASASSRPPGLPTRENHRVPDGLSRLFTIHHLPRRKGRVRIRARQLRGRILSPCRIANRLSSKFSA